MRFECPNDFINKIQCIGVSKKVYIWGICIYGNMLGKLFNKNKIGWDGYYDNFNKNEETQLNGKPIYKGNAVNILEEAVYILAMRNYVPVKNQLISIGISDTNIITFENIEFLDEIGNSLEEFKVSENRIKAFKNIHQGETCFIIGNGPSLCIEDLERIHEAGIVSFASNLIFKCYDKTQWRPDYYFFTDGKGIKETFDNYEVLRYVSENCNYIFSRSNGEISEYIDKVSNLILFRFVFSNSEDPFEFSSDCSEKVYIGNTVTYAMFQVAAYMGFKKIYLLGMDHNFSIEQSEDGKIIKREDVKDHSEILGNYSMWGVPEPRRIERAYLSAEIYANTHGISIFNTTRGGKLEIFKRKSFDEVVR